MMPTWRSTIRSVARATFPGVLLTLATQTWADSEPDILNPGPQMPTYPTNTGTLPQGRAYLEVTPFSYEGSTGEDAGKYYTGFMAHVGATDNLELRVYGSGWTWSEGREDRTSFAPLSFSAVVGFWGEQDDTPWLPAFAVEAFVNTEWLGNSATNSGTHPGVQFAFSKDLPFDTNLNISLGPVRSQQSAEINGATVSREHWDFLFQWALQKELIYNSLSIFAHGFHNGTAAVSVPAEGMSSNGAPALYGVGKTVIGGGLIWTVNDRFSVFGQVSAGTNKDSPSMISWTGVAVAL